jgi:O-antigen/teichoic acid export membrane protein
VKNINQLKAGAILSYASMGLGYVISIAYTPIMLHLLGQSEYGLYNLVSSVVSYLGLLSFGFGSAYMRYYSRYKVNDDQQNIAKLNGMFFIVFSFIGILSIVFGSWLVINIEFVLGNKLTTSELSTAKVLMGIMVMNLSISFPATVFNSYVTANEKYVFQKMLQMVKTVVNPFVMLPILLLGYKSIGMVVATTVINLSIEVINAYFCVKRLKIQFNFRKLDFALMKEIAVFSSYIFVNLIIDQINWNVDKIIIGRFRGTVSVAVYGLAAQLNTYYLSLSMVMANVFIPRVNQMVAKTNNNKDLTNLMTRIGRIQFILLSLISSGFVVFGRPFINMWAGTDYNDAYPIAMLLIIPVTIPLIQNIGIEIQRAKNMHKFRSWAYLLIALVNICVSIPMTKIYGGIGAAIGTSISLLIGNGVLMNWYYHKHVGLDMKFFWSQIFQFIPALIPSVVVGIIITMNIDLYNIWRFLIFGIIYIIVYFISIWFFAMNHYEKSLLSNPVKQMLGRLI